jgi:hypothetical protein
MDSMEKYHFRRRPLLFAAFAILTLNTLFSSVSFAETEHRLMRRLVVFPMRTEKGFEAIGDESWWQARDQLTKSRRFLVASKQLLIKNDAFQSRGALEPADAIILGKLLDAHALLTLELAGRNLTVLAYDGGNGFTLYRKQVKLHPAKTIGDQLPQLTRRLIDDFVATIPYQGYTTIDALVGTAVFQEGGVKYADVDLGVVSSAKAGDLVQWVRVTPTSLAPVFQGGSTLFAFAEGRIARINEGLAVVEVLRVTSLKEISEYSLVRVPREAERALTENTIAEKSRPTLTVELVSPEANPIEQVNKERRPLLTALSFVGSIAGFLLLAF